MITHAQAQALLDLYFAGESSLEQEAQLRNYFKDATDIPVQLSTYAPLFRFVQQEAQLTTSPALDQRLQQPPPARIRHLRSWWSAAAAVACLIVAIFVWWQPGNEQLAVSEETIDWSKYEVQDPSEALRITHGALRRTSVALQQSTRRATEELSQVKKILPNLK